MFYSKKWLWKQANSLLQLALKLCVTKRAVQRHAFLCVVSYFAQKRCVADSTRKQRVSDLYKSSWKSWRLTNHSARIVLPVLQNGFWLANLLGRKSLSCIDFFLHFLLLQLALKLCVTKRAVQRHAFLCVVSYFAQKRCVADSTRIKQNALHISVENCFTHRIRSYFLDTCTKKTSKRVKTIVITLKIKLKKDKVFHYFLN